MQLDKETMLPFLFSCPLSHSRPFPPPPPLVLLVHVVIYIYIFNMHGWNQICAYAEIINDASICIH